MSKAVFKQEEEGSEAEMGFEDLSALTGRVIGLRWERAKTQGKPKNTGMGSLSLLQQIFPT